MTPRFHLVAWALLILCFSSNCAMAELPVARLNAFSPPGGTIGASTDIKTAGQDLDDVHAILFAHPGIVAKPKIDPLTEQPVPQTFSVQIDPAVPEGIYEARVAGRFGISNSRLFAVSHLAGVTEIEPNDSPATASPIALNQAANGRADAKALDYFKLPLEKGQRVLVFCRAREIDSRMDPVLALLDANGRELDRNRHGGPIDFTVKSSGDFILKVHDVLYRGGDDFFYRLEISNRPHIDYIIPNAGLPGTKGKYAVFGRNLPGATVVNGVHINGKSVERLEVEIELPSSPSEVLPPILLQKPASAILDGFTYQLTSTNAQGHVAHSNPFFISFANAPILLEDRSNGRPEQAQSATLPFDFVGQFSPGGDRDWLTFEAKKGEVYWIEMFSHRLGSSTDPFVLLQHVTKNDKGEEKTSDVQELYDLDTNIGGVEFNTATRDIAWRFDVKEGGTYRLLARDLFNPTDNDPSRVYRLSVHKEKPDFRLVALPQAPPPADKDKKEAHVWTPLLRRGDSLPVKILAFRRDNFSGPIHIQVENPPAGLIVHPAIIEEGKTSTTLILTADKSAPAFTGPLRITGKAKLSDVEIVRPARSGSVVWNVPDYNSEPIQARIAANFFLAITDKEAAPVALIPAESKVWETNAAAKLSIPVQITRANGFSEPLKFKPTGLPQLDAAKEVTVPATNSTASFELDLAQLKLGPGSYSFHLYAQAKGKYQRLSGDDFKAAEAAIKTTEEKIAAHEKQLAELQATLKLAADSLAKSTKESQDAEAELKTAAAQFDAAKTAAAQPNASEEVQSSKATSEKQLSSIETKLKAAQSARLSAETQLESAKTKLDRAEKTKAALAELLKQKKEAVQNAQPKDVTLTAYSVPIQIKITPAPEKK